MNICDVIHCCNVSFILIVVWVHFYTMRLKRQVMWNELKAKMGAKWARAETGKRGKNTTAPHELIVQRLAAEPDNKQTSNLFRHENLLHLIMTS